MTEKELLSKYYNKVKTITKNNTNLFEMILGCEVSKSGNYTLVATFPPYLNEKDEPLIRVYDVTKDNKDLAIAQFKHISKNYKKMIRLLESK